VNKDAPSRYKRHLAHLNLTSSVNSDQLQSQEKKEIDDIPLPLLKLEKKKSPLLFPWLTGLALASAALLFIIVPIVQENNQSDLTFKGETRITAIVERNGKFIEFSEEQAQTGDRINFEVLASSPVKVYLTIHDRRDKDLLTKAEILGTEIRIPAGQKASFADAITLTEANDGERAFVVVCPSEAVVQSKDSDSLDFSACSRKTFIFRP
jgi:hypothetical protein